MGDRDVLPGDWLGVEDVEGRARPGDEGGVLQGYLGLRERRRRVASGANGEAAVKGWVSLAFTLTVIANIVALSLGRGQPPAWVTYSPLLPLFVLLFTGLYLFVLPFATKWQRGRRTN